MRRFGKESDLTKLVERCQKQDGEAWGTLVDRFSAFVYSIARRYRLSEADSADVFQKTFLALYQSIDRIAEPDTLPNWIAVTASRLSVRTIRARETTVPIDSPEADLSEVLATEDASAEEEAVRACEALEVRTAVEQLGGRCAPLLRMLYLEEEWTYQAVSDKLGIPVGAIGPTRARCLEKLRKQLEEQDFFISVYQAVPGQTLRERK